MGVLGCVSVKCTNKNASFLVLLIMNHPFCQYLKEHRITFKMACQPFPLKIFSVCEYNVLVGIGAVLYNSFLSFKVHIHYAETLTVA